MNNHYTKFENKGSYILHTLGTPKLLLTDRQTHGQTDGRIETEWIYYCDLCFAKVTQIIYKLLWPENATFKEHKPTYNNALSDVEHRQPHVYSWLYINDD